MTVEGKKDSVLINMVYLETAEGRTEIMTVFQVAYFIHLLITNVSVSFTYMILTYI